MEAFRVNDAGEGKSGLIVSIDTEDDIEYVRIDVEDMKNCFVLITRSELKEIFEKVFERKTDA